MVMLSDFHFPKFVSSTAMQFYREMMIILQSSRVPYVSDFGNYHEISITMATLLADS